MFGRKRERYPFTVTVFFDGRHPYLESTHLDHKSQDVRLTVMAADWEDAEREALLKSRTPGMPEHWRVRVKAIEKGFKNGNH